MNHLRIIFLDKIVPGVFLALDFYTFLKLFCSFLLSSLWRTSAIQTATEDHCLCVTIVTNISLILSVLLDTLQSATGATGLYSQGVTAVVHGCSIHALGPILGETTLLVGWAPSAMLWN